MTAAGHIPVLLEEVVKYLAPQDHEIYVDATFGGGSYTQAFLEAAPCQVIAFDRDPEAIARAHELQVRFGARLQVVEAPFSGISARLASLRIQKVHGIIFDLGVSSFQIDQPERGFSLRFEGPLSMRMDADPTQLSAYTVVNQYNADEIADILWRYGDERKSRRIARAILSARAKNPIETTRQLADLVKRVIPQKGAEHPATRTFQALRIFVNDELGELQQALNACAELLAPGGRLLVVTFHSLEDRLVKEFLHPDSSQSSRYTPIKTSHIKSAFRSLFKKPLVPSTEEVKRNPRARSAKLRAAIRIEELA